MLMLHIQDVSIISAICLCIFRTVREYYPKATLHS